MSNVIALGCVLGLLMGLYSVFTSPPASGDGGKRISGTFAKMRRYMK